MELKRLIYVGSGFYCWHGKILLFDRRVQRGLNLWSGNAKELPFTSKVFSHHQFSNFVYCCSSWTRPLKHVGAFYWCLANILFNYIYPRLARKLDPSTWYIHTFPCALHLRHHRIIKCFLGIHRLILNRLFEFSRGVVSLAASSEVEPEPPTVVTPEPLRQPGEQTKGKEFLRFHFGVGNPPPPLECVLLTQVRHIMLCRCFLQKNDFSGRTIQQTMCKTFIWSHHSTGNNYASALTISLKSYQTRRANRYYIGGNPGSLNEASRSLVAQHQ